MSSELDQLRADLKMLQEFQEIHVRRTMNYSPYTAHAIQAIEDEIAKLEAEVERRVAKERELRSQLEAELAKRYAVQNVLAIADCDFDECEGQWIELRKACGWSGVDGVDPAEPGGDFTVEIPLASREQTLKHADAEDEIQGGLTAGCQPILKAEDLPIGTVMVLGGIRWTLKGRWTDSTLSEWDRVAGGRDRTYTNDEIQELIERGVRFEIPKGGPQCS